MKSYQDKIKAQKWKLQKAKKIKDIDWKDSLLKSIIYRIITVFLGFTTTYIITHDITTALGVSILTELVQFANYFLFDMAWTNLRTRKRIEEDLLKKTIELKINYDSVLDVVYEMSKIDTFVKEVYDSALNFFNSVLENDQLKEYHEEIEKYFEIFKMTHEKREFL